MGTMCDARLDVQSLKGKTPNTYLQISKCSITIKGIFSVNYIILKRIRYIYYICMCTYMNICQKYVVLTPVEAKMVFSTVVLCVSGHMQKLT